MKKIFFIFITTLLFLSCQNEVTYKKGETIYVYPGHVNDNRKNITKKTCRFLNFDDGEKELGKIDAYFLNDTDKKNLIPYVDFFEMFGDNLNLTGPSVLDLNENTATYHATDFIGYPQKYILNWKENTITVTSATAYADYLGFYPSALKQIQFLPTYEKRGKETVYKIGGYGFDILFYKGKMLVPFSLIDSFVSCGLASPVMYNGADFCFTGNPDNLCSDYESDKDKARRFYGNNFKKECPEYLRNAACNALKFHFENFYGLKNLYVEDFISQNLESFKAEILSADPKTYTNGFYKFIAGLKDMHTEISSYLSLFYDETFNEFDVDAEIKETANGFYNTQAIMEECKYGSGNYSENAVYGETPLKYSGSGETLLVNIDVFMSGFDESDTDLSDGWKNNTYAAMRMAIGSAKQKDGVKNIVVDVSTAPGGQITTLLEVLGFMSKNPMFAIYDPVENLYETYKVKIDTNCDGKFDDDDGYPEYNWYILTSPMSFSAANCLACIAQFNGYAKTIGQKSAGGICPRIKFFLPDGLFFSYSGRMALCGARYAENGNKVDFEYSDYREGERGVDPDIEIATMDATFYSNLANNVEAAINAAP